MNSQETNVAFVENVATSTHYFFLSFNELVKLAKPVRHRLRLFLDEVGLYLVRDQIIARVASVEHKDFEYVQCIKQQKKNIRVGIDRKEKLTRYENYLS